MTVLRGSVRGVIGAPEPQTLTVPDACATALGALRDAIDLLLLHNEGPVGGDAPRGVLSPLVVVLAVSAWERTVYELAVATGNPPRERETVGRMSLTKQDKHGREIPDPVGLNTTQVLSAASGGALPGGYAITIYDRASGRRLQRPRPLTGAQDFAALAAEFDAYTELRNGVVHRVTGPRMGAAGFASDAHCGLTINTSLARMVLAAYVQLIDQTIDAVLTHHEATSTDATSTGTDAGSTRARPRDLRLPEAWFYDDLDRTTDAQRPMPPGCLWGGRRLPRT